MNNELVHDNVLTNVNSEYVTIKGKINGETNKYLADVNVKIKGMKDKNSILTGNVMMYSKEVYDDVIFSLLRTMFKMPFPELYVGKYDIRSTEAFADLTTKNINPYDFVNQKFIYTKYFNYRNIQLSDYYPATPDNFNFRFQICLMIYFCKFLGCPFYLKEVKVTQINRKKFNDSDEYITENFPCMWEVLALGLKNAPTVNEQDFCYFFMIDIKDAQTMLNFTVVDDIMNVRDSDLFNIMLYNGECSIFNCNDQQNNSNTGDDDIDEEQNNSNIDDDAVNIIEEINNRFREVETNKIFSQNQNYGMLDMVINFFRECRYDADLLRQHIYFKANPVKRGKTIKRNLPLSVLGTILTSFVQCNYGTLMSMYPYSIFKQ